MTVISFFQNNELILSDENVKVIKEGTGEDIPFQVHTMGLYLVIEAKNGLVLIWDKKTTLMIKLSSTFQVGELVYRLLDKLNINVDSICK